MYIENGGSIRIPASMTRYDFYHQYKIDFLNDDWKELVKISNEIHRPMSVICRSAIKQWINEYKKEKCGQ